MAHDMVLADVLGKHSCGENLFYVVVDCGDPSPVTNGTVIFTSTTFGSTATYSCDTGHTLIGDMTRMCGTDGLYSGSDPTCSCESICWRL